MSRTNSITKTDYVIAYCTHMHVYVAASNGVLHHSYVCYGEEDNSGFSGFANVVHGFVKGKKGNPEL